MSFFSVLDVLAFCRSQTKQYNLGIKTLDIGANIGHIDDMVKHITFAGRFL